METIKICLKKDLPKEFELIKINKYLEKYVKADPMFYYPKEEKKIIFSLICLIGAIFFFFMEKKL